MKRQKRTVDVSSFPSLTAQRLSSSSSGRMGAIAANAAAMSSAEERLVVPSGVMGTPAGGKVASGKRSEPTIVYCLGLAEKEPMGGPTGTGRIACDSSHSARISAVISSMVFASRSNRKLKRGAVGSSSGSRISAKKACSSRSSAEGRRRGSGCGGKHGKGCGGEMQWAQKCVSLTTVKGREGGNLYPSHHKRG